MNRNKIVLFFLPFFLLSLSGCIPLFFTAYSGGGVAMLVNGKMQARVEASRDEAIDAVKRTLSDLDFPIIREKDTEKVYQILSRHSEGKMIHVDIRQGVELTLIEVRVGLITEEEPTQEIMAKILTYLN